MWPSDEPEVKILLDTLKKKGHEVAYWIGTRGDKKLCPQEAIFHDHFDAWDAKPAPALRQAPILPVSAELVSSMYETESSVLTLMNKRYDSSYVDERKHIYYTMLGYWNYVLDEVAPEAIVFNTIPHSIYSNIIYDLGQKRGIPMLCLEETWVARRMLSYSDYRKGSDELRAEIERVSKRVVTESELGEELREYWKEHMQPQSRVAPVYMAPQREIGEGWGLVKHRVQIALKALREGNLLSLVFGYMRRLGKKNLREDYESVIKRADWNVPFVYFPLHFQPERTTSPQGGVYHDQHLVVETLSSALPDGWEIYVKEHPSQWWLRGKTRYSSVRYPGYYERLAKIPRVRLVPISTDTFELTERARAVAVITGTSGWEALLRGKRPLVFGIPWYRDCPDIFRVDSVETCAMALEKIKNGARAPKENLLAFLKAFETVSIRAYLENQLEEKPRYTAQENMQIMASHTCEKLRTLKPRQ